MRCQYYYANVSDGTRSVTTFVLLDSAMTSISGEMLAVSGSGPATGRPIASVEYNQMWWVFGGFNGKALDGTLYAFSPRGDVGTFFVQLQRNKPDGSSRVK